MVASKTSQDNLLFLPHLLGIFTGFIGALVIMLVAEDEQLKKHAKEALNWQFSALIYSVLATLLMITIILIPVSIIALFVIGVLNLVFCIIATVKASNGELWKYPVSIPFFRN
jgi:hypothetical protein